MSVSLITTRNVAFALAWLCPLTALPAMAQTSASYKLSEAAFNNAGNPSQLMKPSSANYRVSLDAIGDEVIGSTLTSASFSIATRSPACRETSGVVISRHLESRVSSKRQPLRAAEDGSTW
jgi:hypothetical protein